MKLFVVIAINAILSTTTFARERGEAADMYQHRREIQSELKKDKQQKIDGKESCSKESKDCDCKDKKTDHK